MTIIPYEPGHKAHFERLNKAWLNKYFVVEPIDEWVLTHPEEAIFKDGGTILFAEDENRIIGTVALKYLQPGLIELTKMAVDEAFQGRGAGKQLCMAAIEEARKLNFERLVLYSTTVLEPAIRLYRKLGFVEVPFEPGAYKRANIKMELFLQTS